MIKGQRVAGNENNKLLEAPLKLLGNNDGC